MKVKIKKWILNYLTEQKDVWYPKKEGNLKAVCFSSKQPLGNGKYVCYACDLTEWVNGEGYQISIDIYNEHSKKTEAKNFSLNNNEIDVILACLNDLNHFED